MLAYSKRLLHLHRLHLSSPPLYAAFSFAPSVSERPDMNAAHFIMEMRVLSHRISRYLSPITPLPHPQPPPCPSPVSQVHLLRTAGDEVTITVRYLREVPSFLKLPLGKNRSVRPHAKYSLAANERSKGVNQTREGTSRSLFVFFSRYVNEAQ